jgi:integrase
MKRPTQKKNAPKSNKQKKERAEESSNKMTFTDLALARLKPPQSGQRLLWDQACKGLALLVSPRGTKAFRVLFKLEGKYQWATLGHYGDVSEDTGEDSNIVWARNEARRYRTLAKQGIDPRKPQVASSKAKGRALTFGDAVTQYIEDYCKDHHRRWDQTQRTLLNNCKAWRTKPIATITKAEVLALLRSQRDKPAKQANTFAWLKTFWRWCWQNDLAPSNLIDSVPFKKRTQTRTRVFSDQEIVTIWNAANACDPVTSAYFKLLILLAPRKTALATMQAADLDDELTLWTTPFEFTKSRKSAKPRKYVTPLPALARRILKGLARDGLVFPGLPLHRSRAGSVSVPARVTSDLIANGAPSDFTPHTLRHTLATWLQNAGHSEWEIGLILNHSASGVTAGYSHGYPLELKRQLLDKWAAHVEQLVQPEGARVLR